MQRNTQLVVRLQEFRIDLIEALGAVSHTARRRIITNRLKIDRLVTDMCPAWLSHLLPALKRTQAPVEHKFRLVLFCRQGSNYIFVQPRWKGVRFDLGDEPFFVVTTD